MQQQPAFGLDQASLQAAGQAAGTALGVQATKAFSNVAEATRSVGESALIDAAKFGVRVLGVDSNMLNTETPGSQYGMVPCVSLASS